MLMPRCCSFHCHHPTNLLLHSSSALTDPPTPHDHCGCCLFLFLSITYSASKFIIVLSIIFLSYCMFNTCPLVCEFFFPAPYIFVNREYYNIVSLPKRPHQRPLLEILLTPFIPPPLPIFLCRQHINSLSRNPGIVVRLNFSRRSHYFCFMKIPLIRRNPDSAAKKWLRQSRSHPASFFSFSVY